MQKNFSSTGATNTTFHYLIYPSACVSMRWTRTRRFGGWWTIEYLIVPIEHGSLVHRRTINWEKQTQYTTLVCAQSVRPFSTISHDISLPFAVYMKAQKISHTLCSVLLLAGINDDNTDHRNSHSIVLFRVSLTLFYCACPCGLGR